MKTKSLIAVTGAFAMTTFAPADWSLSLVHVSDNPETGVGLSAGFGPSTTWHIIAQFDYSVDILGVVGQAGAPMFLNIIKGSVFNQLTAHGHHQNLPPIQAQKDSFPTGWGLDTYITIGADVSPSPVGLPIAFTPGFEDLIDNFTGSWNTNDLPSQEGGWIAIDMPDFAHGTDLLLMQLTVSQGALFELVFGVDTLQHGYLHDWDGISFAEHGVPGSGKSYLTNIPAPGTAIIALLALAAPPVRRRRRI